MQGKESLRETAGVKERAIEAARVLAECSDIHLVKSCLQFKLHLCNSFKSGSILKSLLCIIDNHIKAFAQSVLSSYVQYVDRTKFLHSYKQHHTSFPPAVSFEVPLAEWSCGR